MVFTVGCNQGHDFLEAETGLPSKQRLDFSEHKSVGPANLIRHIAPALQAFATAVLGKKGIYYCSQYMLDRLYTSRCSRTHYVALYTGITLDAGTIRLMRVEDVFAGEFDGDITGATQGQS